MKKIYLYMLVILILFTNSIPPNDDYYYWYNGEKQQLTLKAGKKYVLFNQSLEATSLQNSIKTKKLKLGASLIHHKKSGSKQDIYWAVIPENEIIKLNKNIISYEAPFFASKDGKELGLSHLFYVKLFKKEDIEKLEVLAAANGVEVLGNNKFMPLWYTLACTKSSKGNALDMANLFYETGFFSGSEPDLMEDNLTQCANDPQFHHQWNLRNGLSGRDIDICRAWDISEGCNNIIVAVLDQGLELNHPDLTNLHPVSYDTQLGTSPSQVRGDHGVAVAGIIGANSNNSLGVAGVAPGISLMSISNNMASTPNSRMERADGINFAWQNGASIINNSWSSTVQIQAIDDAIQNAVTSGRNGLGTVVVFSTANNSNNSIAFPSSNPNVIAVGATDRDDKRASFSNYGTGLDVVAPGVEIFTTDRQGVNGYNTVAGINGDFFANFDGTSAAAPQVAGVLALILSANPTLTQAQARQILESTADKVSGYTYNANVAGQPNGTWNNEVGYGRINAFRALQAALPFQISGPGIFCDNSTYTLQGIPPGANVTWQVTPSGVVNMSASGNQATLTKLTSGYVDLSATITGDCFSRKIYSSNIVVGTPSPYDRGFFVDGSSGAHQQLGNSANFVYNRDIYVTLHPSGNYTWQYSSAQGNVGYYHPAGNDGMVIMFGNPPPVYYGDHIGFSIQNNNICGASAEPLYFYFDGPTEHYLLFPNPANDQINIEALEWKGDSNLNSNLKEHSINEVQVLNKFGNLVVSKKYNINTKKVNMDVSRLDPGMYIVRILDGEKIEHKRIVIQRY